MRISILFSLVLMIATDCKQEKRYSPDGIISLQLSEPRYNLPDMLPAMQEVNPNIICLFYVGDSAQNEDFFFTISRMEEEDSMSIQEAFDKYVKDVSPPMTTTLAAGSYEKNGKRLYRKISETDFGEHRARNTMFYFMENDRSNILYEIKGSSAVEKAPLVFAKMEEMASSVRFSGH